MTAIQDHYSENFAACYGCGYKNEHGHQLKTRWDGEDTLTLFTPDAHHTAIPGFVYGGILASAIDCHGTGSGSLALAKDRKLEITGDNAPRCVTASLSVKYLKPTPLGPELKIKGIIREIKGRKIIIDAELYANGVLTVKGEIIVVEVPEGFGN